MSSHPVKTQNPLLKLSSDDSESAAYPSFVQTKPNLTQIKLEFNLRQKMTRYSKNLEVPWPSWLHVCTRGIYNQGFQGVLGTRFGSLESAKIIIGSLESEKMSFKNEIAIEYLRKLVLLPCKANQRS